VTWDEEENAVRQLGELIGYERLIRHAHQLQARRSDSGVNLSRGYCAHGVGLATRCIACEEENPTDTGSVT
jgi:hypothetical protein